MDFPSRGHAYHFLQVESHPKKAKEGTYPIEQRGPWWYITHPKSLLTAIRWGGNQRAEGIHRHARSGVPKVISWHNDIAYTVPVHPQALSKEHMQPWRITKFTGGSTKARKATARPA